MAAGAVEGGLARPRRANTCLVIALAVVAWAAAATGAQVASSADWRTFEATWSAVGERHALAIEQDRAAVILRVSGALILQAGDGLSRGFRAEAIGYHDGGAIGLGRAVWTDDRGDRIFSRLSGDPLTTGGRVEGTITGGTGRYAGLTGSYVFKWQYVMPSDDGRVQGHTVSFTGRYRWEPRP